MSCPYTGWKALVRREMVAALQFEQPDIGLRGQAQRMVRLLVFSRTDGAVTAAALVIVGLGEGTGIAEAEPVACRRDRKCAAEAVAVTAVEGGQFARQQSFARLGEARCQGFHRNRGIGRAS